VNNRREDHLSTPFMLLQTILQNFLRRTKKVKTTSDVSLSPAASSIMQKLAEYEQNQIIDKNVGKGSDPKNKKG